MRLFAHAETARLFVYLSVLFLPLFGGTSTAITDNHSEPSHTNRPEVASLYAPRPVGFDTFLHFVNRHGQPVGTGQMCVSTMIARLPLRDGVSCLVAFLSAAHCVMSGGGILRSWDVSLPGKTVRIQNKPGHLAKNFKNYHVQTHRGPAEQGSDDVAVIRDTVPCSALGDVRPARLATCASDDKVVLPNGQEVFAQKRRSPTGSNYGGGAFFRLMAAAHQDLFGHKPLQRASVRDQHRVQGGDSGGPLSNQKGEVVSVMARASTDYDPGSKAYFDPSAVCFARRSLAKWGMWPPVPVAAPEVIVPEPAAPRNYVTAPKPSVEETVGLETLADGSEKIIWKSNRGSFRVQIEKANDGTITTGFRNEKNAFERLPAEAFKKLQAFYAPYLENEETLAQSFDTPEQQSLVRSIASYSPEKAPQKPPTVSPREIAQEDAGRVPMPLDDEAIVELPPKSADTGTAQAAVDAYKNTQVWVINRRTGKREIKGPRSYFDAMSHVGPEFTDVPKGGTGKVIVAYFGPRRADLEQLVAGNPLIEVRNYQHGSLEHQEAQLFKVQTLAVDGLGRKISRYPQDARQVVQAFLDGRDGDNELARLKAYHEGLAALASARVTAPPTLAPHPSSDPTPTPEREPTPNPTPFHSGDLATGLAKCANCHRNHKSLDAGLKEPQSLQHFVSTMNSLVLEDMLGRSNQLTPAEREAIRQHQLQATPESHSRSRPAENSAANSNPIPACFMSEAERQAKIDSFPTIANGTTIADTFTAALRGRRLAFYDKKSRPLTWLGDAMSGKTYRIKNSRNLLNQDSMEKLGYHGDSGAREFPWKNPAGTDISPGVQTEKFVIPPARGAAAEIIKRTPRNSPTYYGQSSNRQAPMLGWQYQPGATLGEVLKIVSPTGEAIPFEIRLRQKLPNGSWGMDVLRPFENSYDLAAALRKLCAQENRPEGCNQITQATFAALDNPQAAVTNRNEYINKERFGTKSEPLSLNRTAIEAVNEVASVQQIPDLPPDVVATLLKTTPFKSVFGKPWTPPEAGKPAGWAPSTRSAFNIVPRDYFATFIPMTQKGCMGCHDSAGRHVDNFDPYPSQMFRPDPRDVKRPRTWYEWMPGNDGILSLHPYSTSAIQSGAEPTKKSVEPCLLQSGIFD